MDKVISLYKLLAIFILLCLSMFASTCYAEDGKAIAFYYDDSGSMQTPIERWLAANYSLQLLSSLISIQDEMYITKTSSPNSARKLNNSSDISKFLQEMQSEPAPNSGTPYAGISTLISKLENSQKSQKWLVLITDGTFSKINQQQLDNDIEKARKLGIKASFILIEKGASTELANYWKQKIGSEVVAINRASRLPEKMEELAAKLTDRDADGLDIKKNNNQVTVSSIFPLRSMVVITQGNQDVEVSNAYLLSNAGKRALQQLKYDIKSRQDNSNIHKYASVSHLNFAQPIDLGDESAVIEFDGNVQAVDLAILPEVSARLDVSVVDKQGQKLNKNGQGFYELCTGESVVLKSKLTDSNNKSLVAYANSSSAFDVGFVDSKGQSISTSYNKPDEVFQVEFSTQDTVFLHPYAKHKGYFNFQSDTLNFQPIDCQRDVNIINTTELDTDKRWVKPINELNENDHITFQVSIDGNSVSKSELESWQWQYDNEHWQMSINDGQIQFAPITDCCAFVWSRQQAHTDEFKFKTITTNKHDSINYPTPMQYEWASPEGLQKIWWLYACPIVSLISIIAFLWYLYRILFVKARFRRGANIHIKRDGYVTLEPLVRGKNLFMHWFWPSKQEKKVINGITFLAIGRGGYSVMVSGKSLTEQHEIDGWLYDEDAKEQADAKLSDQDVIIKAGIRYDEPEYMLQYTTHSKMPNWPTDDYF